MSTGKPPAAAADLLRRAIEISTTQMRSGRGGPFGAVIAGEDRIVAEGFNSVTSINDPTAHAEVMAIRVACGRLNRFSLAGYALYTSCEPCPMCLGAIYWARLDRVFYANTRAEAAAIGFDDDHIYREFAKPIAGRAIPFIRIELPEAVQAFNEWMTKADKVAY